ncbi:GNAT family N-acetyltransferase [Bradyrhizobium sp. 160]|uniref:GNAT family N-acetyltransferase n=1 Tax=Bradyrhizobium sp. 160 TaxID=2782634 RepID=UPI001FF7DF69|nr:GNAT family N-acetyltransferase [Bradyrhizobium sp. 160]MCK1627305.1 GNAT family N-acetyltransferase [Bradyrhizobium sp. 160]
MMIQIRHASDSDAVWLTRLLSDPRFYLRMGYDPEAKDVLRLAVAKKFELYKDGLGCILIAQHGLVSLGYGAYFHSRSPGYAYIEYGVTPTHFGRGIGGRMLDALIASAKANDAQGLQTVCHPRNVASVALLESRHFIRCKKLSRASWVFDRYKLSFPIRAWLG